MPFASFSAGRGVVDGEVHCNELDFHQELCTVTDNRGCSQPAEIHLQAMRDRAKCLQVVRTLMVVVDGRNVLYVYVGVTYIIYIYIYKASHVLRAARALMKIYLVE